MNTITFPLVWALGLTVALPAQAGPARPTEPVALGRYLVQTAGCNDCHSPGYIQQAGQTPESTWLTGDALGWRGPWGTTEAARPLPAAAVLFS